MVQLCRINPVRSRFCEDLLKYTLYQLIFASQDIIHVPRRPHEPYFLPENFGAIGTSDLLHLRSSEKLDKARIKCNTTDSKNDFQEYFNHVWSLLDISKPANWKEALNMFSYLITVALVQFTTRCKHVNEKKQYMIPSNHSQTHQ